MLNDIFSKLPNEPPTHRNSKILICDGLNLFLRIWASVPLVSDTGEHIGGVVGFLRSLGVVIREYSPTRCIVVFDGKGGSLRRKQLYPDYKSHRTVKQNIRREAFSTPEDEQVSMRNQLARVIHYLNALPVQTMFSPEHTEADDVIGHICSEYFPESKIRIVSTDRDFLQLVSDRIEVYSPVKKKLYNPDDLTEEFGIHPDNYLIYRMLTGDTSDNISGVNGVGLKTFLKYFPEVKEKVLDTDYLLARAKEEVETQKKPKVIFKTILESKEILERNLQLMQLQDVDISANSKMQINEFLNSHPTKLNRIEFRKLSMIDSLTTTLKDVWLDTTFNSLAVWAKQ